MSKVLRATLSLLWMTYIFFAAVGSAFSQVKEIGNWKLNEEVLPLLKGASLFSGSSGWRISSPATINGVSIRCGSAYLVYTASAPLSNSDFQKAALAIRDHFATYSQTKMQGGGRDESVSGPSASAPEPEMFFRAAFSGLLPDAAWLDFSVSLIPLQDGKIGVILNFTEARKVNLE